MRQVFATIPLLRKFAKGIDRKLSKTENPNPATLSGGYRGADAAGQTHLEYPPNTYILPVMSTGMLVLEVPFGKLSRLAYRPFSIYFEKIKEKAQALPEEAAGALAAAG